jgi:hypothetical protein
LYLYACIIKNYHTNVIFKTVFQLVPKFIQISYKITRNSILNCLLKSAAERTCLCPPPKRSGGGWLGGNVLLAVWYKFWHNINSISILFKFQAENSFKCEVIILRCNTAAIYSSKIILSSNIKDILKHFITGQLIWKNEYYFTQFF